MEESKTSKVNYAGAGRRLVASIVDGLILGVILIPFNMVISAYTNNVSDPGGLYAQGVNSDYSATNVGFTYLLTLLMVVIQLAYYIYFIGSKGQTPGKMALGVKVVRKDGVLKIGYGKAFMREVVGKFISSLVFGLGYLWILWDKEKQGWHDKIANTVVVRTK